MWQRAGVVASVLWLPIGAGSAFLWESSAAHSYGENARRECVRRVHQSVPTSDFSHDAIALHMAIECDHQDWDYPVAYYLLENRWRDAAIAALAPLIPGWLFGYAAVWAGRWVLGGRRT